jgi:hypothetical protein
MPVEQALVACAEFWQSAPFTPYYLDHANISEWPDPWQLVYENYYCDLAKVLGIVYTLHLSDHGPSLDLGIRVYLDTTTRGQYNLAWIDSGKYVLNFNLSETVNRTQVPNEFRLLAEFSSQELKLHNY